MGLQKDKNKTSILLILQKKNHLFTLAFITRLDIKLAISLYQTSTHPIHPFVTYPLHPWSLLPRHPFLTRLPTHTHFFSLSLLFSVFSFILYRFLISAQRALRTPGEIEGWLKWAARWQEHRGSEGERERDVGTWPRCVLRRPALLRWMCTRARAREEKQRVHGWVNTLLGADGRIDGRSPAWNALSSLPYTSARLNDKQFHTRCLAKSRARYVVWSFACERGGRLSVRYRWASVTGACAT